jgi:uncharacterized phage-associated protein
MQRLPFNEVKTTQAASRFLELAGGKLNYMVLIKLLYLLDRASLLKWRRPVTFDEYYSMKHGPVLSEVLSLITEMTPPFQRGYWAEHISAPSEWSVTLRAKAGDDALSEAEEELIQSVFEQYRPYFADDPFVLVKFLHDNLPEWTETQSGRVPILHRDILAAENKSEAEISAVVEELDSLASDYRVLLAR